MNAPFAPSASRNLGERGSSRPTRALYALIAVAGLLAYAHSFSAALTLDNKIIVTQDPRLQSASWDALKAIFTQDYWWPVFPSNLYRPLTTLSLWVNYTLLGNGVHVAGYHWINLALHLFNAGLVATLAARLTRSQVAALWAGLIFAVHPITVEAVTNIVGRADLLATLCVLLALHWHWRSRSAPGTSRSALMALAMVAGVLCKENAIAVVPAIIALDWLGVRPMESAGESNAPDTSPAASEAGEGCVPPMRTPPAKRSFWAGFPGRYWTLAPAVAVFAAIQLTIGRSSPLRGAYFLDNPIVGASPVVRFLTAAAVQAKSLGLLLWPATLSCDYSYDQIPVFGSGHPAFDLSAWAFVAAVLGAALLIWRARHQPLLLAGLVCYLVFLLPTANVLKVIGAVMAERFLYLPLVGFAWAIAAAATWLSVRWRRPGWIAALGVGLAGLLALRTDRRNADWQNDLSLWRSTVAAAPNSYKSHKGLAAAMAEADPSEAGIDRAIAEAEIADRIVNQPEILDHPERRETTVEVDLGQYYKAKADLRMAAHDAAGARRYLNRTIAVLQQAEKTDHWIQADLRQYQLQQGKRPDQIRRMGRQDLYQTLAIALAQTGRTAEAKQAALEVVQLNPNDAGAFEFLASCENRLGQRDAAIAALYFAIFANHSFGRGKDELTVLLERAHPNAGTLWLGSGDDRTINAANPVLRPELVSACRRYDRLWRQLNYPEGADAFRQYAEGAFHLTAADWTSGPPSDALSGF